MSKKKDERSGIGVRLAVMNYLWMAGLELDFEKMML
jgi:hypothetical protein